MALQEVYLKYVPGTNFNVDGFRFPRPWCRHYFLTHFHGDHTCGLGKRWRHGHVYCSPETARLVQRQIGVRPSLVVSLPLFETAVIDGVRVTPLPADHCPGAAMFLFDIPAGYTPEAREEGRVRGRMGGDGGQSGACGPAAVDSPNHPSLTARSPPVLPHAVRVLHTGDFRWSKELAAECLPFIRSGPPIDILMLDTTYCSKRWRFPSAREAVEAAAKAASRIVRNKPQTLVLCQAYTIGKERLAFGIARELGARVAVESEARLRTMLDLDLPPDWASCFSHVVSDPTAQVRIAGTYGTSRPDDVRRMEEFYLRPPGIGGDARRSGGGGVERCASPGKPEGSEEVVNGRDGRESGQWGVREGPARTRGAARASKLAGPDPGATDGEPTDARSHCPGPPGAPSLPFTPSRSPTPHPAPSVGWTDLLIVKGSGWTLPAALARAIGEEADSAEGAGVRCEGGAPRRGTSGLAGKRSRAYFSKLPDRPPVARVRDAQPHTTFLDVPYSEHSSWDELRACVRVLAPGRIVSTVALPDSRDVREAFTDLLDFQRDRSRMDGYLTRDGVHGRFARPPTGGRVPITANAAVPETMVEMIEIDAEILEVEAAVDTVESQTVVLFEEAGGAFADLPPEATGAGAAGAAARHDRDPPSPKKEGGPWSAPPLPSPKRARGSSPAPVSPTPSPGRLPGPCAPSSAHDPEPGPRVGCLGGHADVDLAQQRRALEAWAAFKGKARHRGGAKQAELRRFLSPR